MKPTLPTHESLVRCIGGGVAIVECGAPWSAPCRLQEPIAASVVQAHADRVRSVSVDVDAEPDVARRLGIRTIPTLILFADGRERRRLEGLQPADVIAGAVRDLLAARPDPS